MSPDARSIAIELIYANPDQPRTIFDEAKLAELAASIKQHGLLEPIRVAPDGSGRFMIICGERRYRAHLLIGLTEIDCVVVEATPDEIADQAIVENLQRHDISPLEEARAFQRRLDSGISVEDLAGRLGIKQPHRIRDRLALLKLDAGQQDAFSRGLINASQAYELSQLPPAFRSVLMKAIQDGRCKGYPELRAISLTLQKAAQDSAKPFSLEVIERRQAEAGQACMFAGMAEPSPKERAMATAFEKKVQAVVDMLQGGFKDNEVVILHKVRGDRVDVVAQQLDLIEKQLKTLRLKLISTAATAPVS